ncbi:hypothetical protein GCM10008171_32700 [Methylopila jiangsuensis]|uniref:Uncharacterized protein n=1 Tax=Methylopila jiangsuensis TaxID=586230 RepID=A0A9W6JI12_9HYPH|nr:hypothetical protein [Methylopila jiangsuensis]MDR6284595.1 DNA-directed RNA polymerase specialized sigma24 family protein [Methylopila jiangsuensis]GLK78016.1 hypothetical protein GCM10008171_32700 [Methylopila jiangsuensis]
MTEDQKAAALSLWCAGCDTAEIARRLGLPEAAVYNALSKRPSDRRAA